MLSRGLLFFWSAWFTVVLASNLADGLREAGIFSPGWRFASGNYSLIERTVAVYAWAESSTAILFGGVVLWQLGAAILFWTAFLRRETVTKPYDPSVLGAFTAGIGLFAAFLVADELFLVYEQGQDLEVTHLLVLCALLLSYLVIHVLSARPTSDRPSG